MLIANYVCTNIASTLTVYYQRQHSKKKIKTLHTLLVQAWKLQICFQLLHCAKSLKIAASLASPYSCNQNNTIISFIIIELCSTSLVCFIFTMLSIIGTARSQKVSSTFENSLPFPSTLL